MTEGRRYPSRTTRRWLVLVLVALALGAVLVGGARPEPASVRATDPVSLVAAPLAGAEATLVAHLPATAERAAAIRSASPRWTATKALESLLWLVVLLGVAAAALTGCGLRRADDRSRPSSVRALLPTRRGPPHLV